MKRRFYFGDWRHTVVTEAVTSADKDVGNCVFSQSHHLFMELFGIPRTISYFTNPQLCQGYRRPFPASWKKMVHSSMSYFASVLLLLVVLSLSQANGFLQNEKEIKSAVFLSPRFELGLGSVVNTFYFDIDFPRGHIGLKSFDAEVVDEAGNPIPLHETYLHHWVIAPYHVRKGLVLSEDNFKSYLNNSSKSSEFGFVYNSGLCQRDVLRHYFGMGSETRKTSSYIPDGYAVEIGNPEEVPEGQELKWLLNIHAIDTRGVEDKLGCTECRCNLYNVTFDKHGRPLRPDYVGGLNCCHDKSQCRLRQPFQGAQRRNLYLRYTVRWVDWSTSVLPVKIYIFDVTDTWQKPKRSTGLSSEHHCKIEYDIKSCRSNDMAGDGCVDARRISLEMPFSGYLVYGVAHQHAGGIGSALYRQNGEAICSSMPIYGKGSEAGDEAGYIEGMSTCYPKSGSVEISAGETLIMESNYSRAQDHTGVMGLFLILVAENLPNLNNSPQDLILIQENGVNFILSSSWLPVAMIALVVAAAIAVLYRRWNNEEDGYQSLVV